MRSFGWVILALVALTRPARADVPRAVPMVSYCVGALAECARAGATWAPLSLRASLESQLPKGNAPVTLRGAIPSGANATTARVQGGNNTKRIGVLAGASLVAAGDRRAFAPLWIELPPGATDLLVQVERAPAVTMWPFVVHVGATAALAADLAARIVPPAALVCWALVIALLQLLGAVEARNRLGSLLVAGTSAAFAARTFVMQRHWVEWWTLASVRVGHAVEYASLPVAVMFVDAFYRWVAGLDAKANATRIYQAVGMLLTVLCFVVPMGSAGDLPLLRTLQIFVLLGAGRIVWAVRAALAHAHASERPLVAGGVGALVVSGLVDIYVSQTTNDFFLGVGFVACGFIVETICQALIVAKRSSRAHDRVDELAGELEAKNVKLQESNEVLEAELAERRRVQGELDHATQQLTHAENMATLGMLMAGIAHDLRNPLNYVQSAASQLEESLGPLAAPEEPARTKALESVATATRWVRQGTTVMDAISLAMRNQSRGGNADLEVVNLREVVGEALLLCRSRTSLCTVDVQITEAAVYADPTGVGQIVMNLVSNAADALMERREADRSSPTKILVRASATASGFVLEVHDSGAGIPESLRTKILEPFFSTKPRGQGTGLGLAIVQRVVRQHNATLSVERSEVLGGALFRMRFPGGAS
jgi:signal transduction histidine kinase